MDEPLVRYTRTADGVGIAYWRLGEGRPLVLLPSLPHSHIRAEWAMPAQRRMFELAAAATRVVRYDGRGMGLSERDVENFSLETMLLDLDAVVGAVGEGPVAIGGAANAGAVAIAYTARFPERVSHLLLWCPVADGAVPAGNQQLKALRKLVESDWEMFVQTAAHTMVGWSDPETASQFADVIRAGITPATLQAMLPAIHGMNVWEDLERVRCPTLVMYRPGAGFVLDGGVERIVSRIPGAQLALFDGEASMPYLGNWRAVLRTMITFLGVAPSEKAGAGTGRSLRLLSMRQESLTAREQEIVELVVRGLTNREIAQELYLAEKTVENHIGRMLVKLDLPSRTRLAVYAVEQGLTAEAPPPAAYRD